MIALLALLVGLVAPITSPVATFMYAIGTGDLGCLKYLFDRTPTNDSLTVLTWFLHLGSGLACSFLKFPLSNVVIQIYLGTIVQHKLWMVFNPHKRAQKEHLFVPFWSLPLFEMWKDVCVTILPILLTVWVFGF